LERTGFKRPEKNNGECRGEKRHEKVLRAQQWLHTRGRGKLFMGGTALLKGGGTS